MTLPLVALAVLTVLGAFLGLPHMLHFSPLRDWLEPVTRSGTEILFAARGGEAPQLSWPVETMLLILAAVLAIFFARRGFRDHAAGLASDAEFARAQPALEARLAGAWGIDRAFSFWVVQPVKLVAFLVAVLIDQFAIDGIVNGVGQSARESGRRLRKLADGSIASYGIWMGGAAALTGLIWLWGGGR